MRGIRRVARLIAVDEEHPILCGLECPYLMLYASSCCLRGEYMADALRKASGQLVRSVECVSSENVVRSMRQLPRFVLPEELK